jgi:hypothetical protein
MRTACVVPQRYRIATSDWMSPHAQVRRGNSARKRHGPRAETVLPCALHPWPSRDDQRQRLSQLLSILQRVSHTHTTTRSPLRGFKLSASRSFSKRPRSCPTQTHFAARSPHASRRCRRSLLRSSTQSLTSLLVRRFRATPLAGLGPRRWRPSPSLLLFGRSCRHIARSCRRSARPRSWGATPEMAFGLPSLR